MARKATAGGTSRRKGKSASTGRKAPPKSAGKSSYERRLDKYKREHPGWKSDPHWKQKARGHVEREHVTRKSRFEERAKEWFRSQAMKIPGVDVDDVVDTAWASLQAQIKEQGEGLLRRMQDAVARLNERWRNGPTERIGGKSRPRALGVSLDELGEDFDMPWEIFGYH